MSAGVGRIAVLSLICAVPALSACNSTPPTAVVATPAAPEPPAPGVIGAAIGRELDATEKERAIAAQQEAVSAGVRKSWRGAHGSYGFIEPGPESALAGGCRDYTHKIYIKGRPQQAKGQACKKPDGSWRVTG